MFPGHAWTDSGLPCRLDRCPVCIFVIDIPYLVGRSGFSFRERLERSGVGWQKAKEGSVRTAEILSIRRTGNTVQGQG